MSLATGGEHCAAIKTSGVVGLKGGMEARRFGAAAIRSDSSFDSPKLVTRNFDSNKFEGGIRKGLERFGCRTGESFTADQRGPTTAPG